MKIEDSDYHLTLRPFVGMQTHYGHEGFVINSSEWVVHIHFLPTDPGEELWERWSLFVMNSQVSAMNLAYKLIAHHNPECPLGMVCEGHA